MEIHNKTILWFNRSTRMAHTPTTKPELGSIVCKQFCIALLASRCLNKHLTGALSSYTPLLVLGPAPHDPRVHKPTIHKTRMTRRLYCCSARGNRHVAPTLPRSQVSTTSHRTLSIPPTQTQSRQLQHRHGQAHAREAPRRSLVLFWPYTVTQARRSTTN